MALVVYYNSTIVRYTCAQEALNLGVIEPDKRLECASPRRGGNNRFRKKTDGESRTACSGAESELLG